MCRQKKKISNQFFFSFSDINNTDIFRETEIYIIYTVFQDKIITIIFIKISKINK